MMMRILATTTLLALTPIFILTVAVAPAHADPREVLGSKYDHKVQTKTGSCVRTKWQDGSDVCGVKKEPPAPIPEPAPYVAPAPKPVVLAPRPLPPVRHTIIKEEARTIYFDSGKSVLTKGGEKKLDHLAATLKEADDIQRVDIVGYADPMGTSKSNQTLSEKRAEVVEGYLHKRGYLKTAVAKTRAVGDKEASANCSKKLKRAKKIDCLVTDRKVEVQVVYETEQ